MRIEPDSFRRGWDIPEGDLEVLVGGLRGPDGVGGRLPNIDSRGRELLMCPKVAFKLPGDKVVPMLLGIIRDKGRAFFLISSVLTLTLGIFIYWLESKIGQTRGFLFEHLPDGLWAFSLTAVLIVIWWRNPILLLFWTLCAVVMMAGFEFLQHAEIFRGTGDLKDILTYLLFVALALALRYFGQSHEA